MNLRIFAAVVGALLLAACSGKPPAQTVRPVVTATAASEIDAIADLLYEGKHKDARRRLDSALQRDSMNPSLMLLKQAITGDAHEDLGPQSFPYVVQSGDTMTKLAERFLGNRLKAYQLARYNDIDKPNSLTAGTVLRVPGQAPRPSSAPGVARAPSPRGRIVAPAPAQQTASRPARADGAGLAAARRAHTAGLAALHQGLVNDAVAKLRRAATLDPGNAVITRDLARAERIAATVRARQ